MGNEVSKAKYSKMDGSQPRRPSQPSPLIEATQQEQPLQQDTKVDPPQTDVGPINQQTTIRPASIENTITDTTANHETDSDESDSKLEKLKKGMMGRMNTLNYEVIPTHH